MAKYVPKQSQTRARIRRLLSVIVCVITGKICLIQRVSEIVRSIYISPHRLHFFRISGLATTDFKVDTVRKGDELGGRDNVDRRHFDD
jgi:hypothetical protein